MLIGSFITRPNSVSFNMRSVRNRRVCRNPQRESFHDRELLRVHAVFLHRRVLVLDSLCLPDDAAKRQWTSRQDTAVRGYNRKKHTALHSLSGSHHANYEALYSVVWERRGTRKDCNVSDILLRIHPGVGAHTKDNSGKAKTQILRFLYLFMERCFHSPS